MVLPGVNLFQYPTNSGKILPNQHKAILCDVSVASVFSNQLDVSKTLLTSANFILTFDYQQTSVAQNALGLLPCLEVQFKDGFMVFLVAVVTCSIVAIIVLKVLMPIVRSSPRRVHIRRV